jgi:DNA-binding transcriptional MerR regulator
MLKYLTDLCFENKGAVIIYYRIQEISKLLNLKPETIRYYEKCGAVKPKRNPKNNYREYSIYDLLTFMQIQYCREIGLPVKEVSSFIRSTSSQIEYLKNFQQTLLNKMQQDTPLIRRIDDLLGRASQSGLQELPRRKLFRISTYRNDSVETVPGPWREFSNARLLLFTDVLLNFHPHAIDIYLALSESYFMAASGLELREDAEIPAGRYYCSHVSICNTAWNHLRILRQNLEPEGLRWGDQIFGIMLLSTADAAPWVNIQAQIPVVE